MKTGVIYRIYNLQNGKSYIGQTVAFNKRINAHFKRSRKTPLYHAIAQYGAEAFKIEILEDNVSENLLDKLEILHIRFFNCKAPNGYNLTDGGEGTRGRSLSIEHRRKIGEASKGNQHGKGYKHSAKARQKISESSTGKNNPMYGKPSPMKGKRHSPESLEKMRAAHTGKKMSLEARAKMSTAHKGNQYNKGRKHSAESRKKMSESHKGHVPWNKDLTGVFSHSPEVRQKMSQRQSGENNPMYGKPSPMKGKRHSPETLKKMSDAAKGKKHTAETRRKISEIQKGKKRRPHSPETRQKMSEAAKRREHRKKSSPDQLLLKL